MSGKDDLSLYFHIPFCTQKCPYCHFYSLACTEDSLDAFLKALLAEIQLRAQDIQGRTIVSLYCGGGTPFLFSPKRLEKVLSTLSSIVSFENCEFTLEANPETVKSSWLQEYPKLGVNRLSIGAQSFNEAELAFLQRNHSPEDIERTLYSAIDAGISNLSIDLMYELPSQTMEAWKHSLDKACKLPVTHLSLYNFMIEEPSTFFRKKEILEPLMPGEELSKNMYEKLLEETSLHGFRQYEISAFARNNLYSRHNVGYWQGREFIGFGPSAFSFYRGKRFSNVSNLSSYCSELAKGLIPINFTDEVSPDERKKELLVINLRMNEGVDLARFQKKWGKLHEEVFSTLLWLEKICLLKNQDGKVMLTDQGRLVYDRVAAELL